MPGFWDQLQQYAVQDSQRAEANESRKMQIAQMLMAQSQGDSEIAMRSLDLANTSLLGQLSELNKSDQFGRGLLNEKEMQDKSESGQWNRLLEQIKSNEEIQKTMLDYNRWKARGDWGNNIETAKLGEGAKDAELLLAMIGLIHSMYPTKNGQPPDEHIPRGYMPPKK